jgi:hypothetical protein
MYDTRIDAHGWPLIKKTNVEERPRYALRCGCDDATFCAVNAAGIALLTASLLFQVTTRLLFSLVAVSAITPYEKRSPGVRKISFEASNEETPPTAILLHIFPVPKRF